MKTNYNKITGSLGDRIFTYLIYIILIIAAAATLFPFLDVVLTSVTPTEEIVKNAKRLISVPKHPTLSHYIYILKGDKAIVRALLITIFRTCAGTFLSMAVTVLTAYPLSKKFLPGRNILMKIFFFTMIFNGGMIPTYLVVRSLGLTDTLWAFILPCLLNVYNMIIMRTFFMGLPAELEEAAKIDGCSDWRLLIRIILPISMPVMASIGLFYAVAHWNAFFDTILYVTDRNLWPLQTLLREILLSTSVSELQLGNIMSDATPPSNAIIAATIMISTIPIICVYPFLQKYFVKGVMIGSVKG